MFASQNGLNHAALEKAALTSGLTLRWRALQGLYRFVLYPCEPLLHTVHGKVTIRKQLKDVVHQAHVSVSMKETLIYVG